MRIVDQISHPILKITIFHLNDKYAVKIENGPYEQIYKFKDTTPLEVIKNTIDKTFINISTEIFSAMHENKMAAFRKNLPDTKQDFEEII